MQNQKIKRIVFYRIGAIGDIIHTLPLIKLCAEYNPMSTIELIVGSAQVKELLDRTCPFITRTYLIKHKGGFDKPLKIFPRLDEAEKVLKESFHERPADEFIYLHSSYIKAFFLNKRIIKAKKLFVYRRDSNLSAVANFVSTRYPDLKRDLQNHSFDILKYKTLNYSQEEGFEHDTDPYVCIVLGVGSLRPHRAYPLLRWFELIDKIIDTSDLKIKILGGPDELSLSREFEETLSRREAYLKINYKGRIENLIGKTSLYELAGILKHSQRLYSADTGILHIAAALDVPISAVFSITSEKRFAPFNPKAKLYRSMKCACNPSSTNIPKHCSKTIMGYAGCSWDPIEMLELNR